MHWTRKTIYILLTAFILAYFLYFYIQNIFLPVQFKRFITARAAEYLHRAVTIEDIHFSALHGFIARNINVYQKDDPQRIFLHSDELSFHILLAPVFSQKVVLIPAMRIKEPFIQIVRQGENRWNFTDLLPVRKSPRPKGGWTILPGKVIIKDGEIAYTDETPAQNFHEVISDIDMDVRVSLTKNIRFHVEGKIPRRESSLSLKGNYDIDGRKLSCRLLAQGVALAPYLSLVPLPAGVPGISVQDGTLTALDVNLNLERGDIRAQGGVTLDSVVLLTPAGEKIETDVQATDLSLDKQQGRWNIKGSLQTTKTRAVTVDGRSAEGKIRADVKNLDIAAQGISAQGNLSVHEVQILPGEDRTILARTLKAGNISLRKADNGVYLQAALDVEGIDAVFSPHQKLTGNLRAPATKLAFEGGKLGISGEVQFTDGRLDLGPERYLQANLKSPQTLVVCEQDTCRLTSDLGLENAQWQLAPGITIQGQPGAHLAYQYNPRYDPALQKSPHAGSADLDLTGIRAQGIPHVDTLENVRGSVRIETDKISGESLTFRTLGTDLALSGSLTGFTAPALDIEAKTENLDLQKLFSAFPVLAQKTNIVPVGTARVAVAYRGDLKNPGGADVRVTTQLYDTTLTSPKFAGEITKVSGEIGYQKDLIVLKNLRGSYGQKEYTLNGQLADFSRPVVDMELASSDLNLTTQIKILNQAFQIASLAGKYRNSSVDLKGDVHLVEAGQPDLDIRGTFALTLEDLATVSPALKERLDTWQPIGTLTGEGLFQGRPRQWQDWALTFTAHSPTVSLNGFYVDDITLQYEQRDRHVSKCNLLGRVYNGNLNIFASADLTQGNVLAALTGALENTDLAALRKNKLPDNKFLAGQLTASLNLSGDLKSPAQWKGGGTVSVADGHLWHWDILDGLLGALLIPEFRDIVFTDGQANFSVENGKVTTEDATLEGNTISLKARGWIDFDQNLDLEIVPVFAELAAAESESLKKIPSLLLAGGDYISVRLTGTLRHPRYKVDTLPFKVLEKTTNFLKDGVKEGIGTILKEIF